MSAYYQTLSGGQPAKILIGVSTRGIIRPGTATMLWRLAQSYAHSDIELALAFDGFYLLEVSRALLVKRCLEGGFDALMMIDDDIAFDPSALRAMWETGLDCVGLTYRDRAPGHPDRIVPIVGGILSAPTLVNGGHRVVEVQGIGGGALLVRRRVLEALVEKHPELRLTCQPAMGTGDFSHVFKTMTIVYRPNGSRHLLSEDYAFNVRCRAAGFKTYAMYDVETAHAGLPFRWSDYPDQLPAPMEAPWIPDESEVVSVTSKARLRRHDAAPKRARRKVA